MSDYINKIFGPFGFNNVIGLMIIQLDSVVLLKFELWTSLKYGISQQVPSIFSNTIDNLINSCINELICKFENNQILYNQI